MATSKFTPKSIEDIIDYYGLDYITLMVIDTDEAARNEIMSFIDKVKASGSTMFDKMEIENNFKGDALDAYVEDYIDNYGSDIDSETYYMTSPEWMFAIVNKKENVDMGSTEITWETCTAYFDRSFGNYLPDYEEHSMDVNLYLDCDMDSLFMEFDEFKSEVMEPVLKLIEDKEKGAQQN